MYICVRVLVACEYSGRVRDAFIAQGHDAMSCDILPTEAPGPHHRGDVSALLREPWDLVIGFPPCTDLSASNGHRLKIKEADGRSAAAAMFFFAVAAANAPRVCVENPAGIMTRLWRRPDQYVDPWWFGDPYRKRTGLWLRGLPLLTATHSEAAYPDGIGYWISTGRQGRKPLPGVHLGHRNVHLRSLTFQGLANAMAAQWGAPRLPE